MNNTDKLLLKIYDELPTPENIWNFRQNIPELVVKDIAKILELNEDQKEAIRKILIARGVNKWLKVRRDLIAYKHQLKYQIKNIHKTRMEFKNNGETYKAIALKETQKTLEKIRADLRTMCHSERYVEWPKTTHRKVLRSMNTVLATPEN